MIHIGSSRLQNPVSEAAEQRAGQAEEPELIHGVRTWVTGIDGLTEW